MAGPSQTRQIGTATRIYKNGAGTVLAIDDIVVVDAGRFIKDSKHYITGKMHYQRTLLHLKDDCREIDSILMIGNYSTISADRNVLSWTIEDGGQDIEIDLSSQLPQIGDEIG